jgi:hypothetical protein
MVVLDASWRNERVPPLAAWSLVVGIVATVGANLAHDLGHGPIGALVSAWPAVALVGSFELLMTLIPSDRRTSADDVPHAMEHVPAPEAEHDARRWHRMRQHWSVRSGTGTARAQASAP